MALLVIAALVMVISQAISVGPFDAYTIRKVLPRMLVAVILISLSWPLLHLTVNFFNALGNGVRALIESPFKDFKNATVGGTSLSVGGLAAIAVMGSLEIMGVLTFVVTALIAVFIAFATLVIRQMLVLLLVVLAPFAIACYILPNTESVWKRWKDLFLRTLVVFPIISAFIATGRVFAKVASVSDKGLLGGLIVFVAYFGPYFMLPMAFKMAGGAIGAVNGALNNAAAGSFAGLKKFRQGSRAKKIENIKSGNLFKGGAEGGMRDRLNTFAKGVSYLPKAGIRPDRMRAKLRSAMNDASEARVGKFMQESESFNAWSGDDAKVWASKFDGHDAIGAELERQDADRFAGTENRRAREDAIAQIVRTKREVDSGTFHRARVRAQAKTGTGYQREVVDANGVKHTIFDAAMAMEDINTAYGSDRNGAGKALSEMRTSLQQSGQMAGAAAYGTWATQMESLYRNNTAENHVIANNEVLDSAMESCTPGQAVYGKPSSAAALGQAHARRIQVIADEVNKGTKTQDDLSAAVAGAAGILDAMGMAAPLNASAFANELMSQEVGAPIARADGTVVSRGTVREYIDEQMGSNAEFVNRRRDLGASTGERAEAERMAAARLAAGIRPAADAGSASGGAPQPPQIAR